jgi:hypothetical protein
MRKIFSGAEYYESTSLRSRHVEPKAKHLEILRCAQDDDLQCM